MIKKTSGCKTSYFGRIFMHMASGLAMVLIKVPHTFHTIASALLISTYAHNTHYYKTMNKNLLHVYVLRIFVATGKRVRDKKSGTWVKQLYLPLTHIFLLCVFT